MTIARRAILATFSLILASSNPVLADSYPERGSLKSNVESQYGTPDAIDGPVGTPPITKWYYEGFTVVFEYDHVIHAFRRETKLENRPSTTVPARPGSGTVLEIPDA